MNSLLRIYATGLWTGFFPVASGTAGSLLGLALWLWVLPAYLANVLVLGPAMVAQHAGCEPPTPEHTFRHSNTFLSAFFNRTMFNIGYHAVHHTHSHVHWSDLPRVHADLRHELVEDGAHVVPFGYFRGGQLLSNAALGLQRDGEG